MITITQTCDACKKEVSGKDQFWNVAISIGCDPCVANCYDVKHKAQWCRSCMEDRGLCCNTESKDTPVPEPTATLESLIREIVQQELSE